MKMTNWKVLGAALATLLVSGGVFAQRELSLVAKTLLSQQEVLLVGSTTDATPQSVTVKVDSAGRLLTTSTSSPSGAAAGTHGACTNTTMNVGTTGTACPAVARTNRASIMIQLNQAGETLRVTSDGSTVATATVGVAVASGATYTDNLAGTVSTNCRCTAATCEVVLTECP